MEFLGKAVHSEIPSFLLVRETSGHEARGRDLDTEAGFTTTDDDSNMMLGSGVQVAHALRPSLPRYCTVDMLLTRDGREGSTNSDALLEYLSTLGDSGVEQCVLRFPNIREGEPFEVIRDRIMPYINQV